MQEDAIPGHPNDFQVIPTKEGTYKGKCAELCGEYHASMLFNVKVVSQEEFDEHMQWLRDNVLAPSDALARFPQLLVAPALLALMWNALFQRFAPLDVKELMSAHLDLLFGRKGDP